MKSAFRKISRVGSLTGGTKWYLSDDCLLAAKRTMYVVEYRRFYLRDLQSVVVWPSRLWMLRLTIPGVLFLALGASLWLWANSTAGAISVGVGLAWVVLESVLGPTAESRIATTGITVQMPLVKRTRRASKVLDRIDEAVRAARPLITQPETPISGPQPAEVAVAANDEAVSAAPAIADAPHTGGL